MIMWVECVHKLNLDVRCLVWWILTTFVTYWYMAATTEYNHDNITIKYASAFQLTPLTNQLESYGFGQIMTGVHQHRRCCCKCQQNHYNDVKMGAMASQITSPTIVHSTVYSRRGSKKTSKPRVTDLCAGNSPVTGECSAQMASNAENVSIWWRHHVHDYCSSIDSGSGATSGYISREQYNTFETKW